MKLVGSFKKAEMKFSINLRTIRQWRHVSNDEGVIKSNCDVPQSRFTLNWLVAPKKDVIFAQF